MVKTDPTVHPLRLHFIRREFGAMEGLLANCAGKFAVGDEISHADCFLVPQIRNALLAGIDLPGEFPTMVVHMVKVGENSGNLETVLWNVAEFYDRDVDEAVSAMISMIEPTLIAVMGGMMAWIALAVFGPLYANLGAIG